MVNIPNIRKAIGIQLAFMLEIKFKKFIFYQIFIFLSILIYRPPSQGSFTETITEHFSKINTNDTEIYILGDFNINLFSKQKYSIK